MFGTAFGQVAGGAVSDIKGRKPVALTGLIVYCLAVAAIVFASSTEQLLNLRAVQAFGAGVRRRHGCSHRRCDGARLLFRTQSRADVCPYRHHSDGCAAGRTHGRRIVAGIGRMAGDFRFLGGVFAGAARFGTVFPAQSRRRRQNRQGCVRAGGGAVQARIENPCRDGLSVFSGIQLRFDVRLSDRIFLRVPAALPRYAAPVRMGVCTQHHHDDVFQPRYRVAA